MATRKRNILLGVLGAVLVLTIVSSSALGWEKLYSPRRANIYSDVLGDDWLIVQAYADIVGERYVVAPSPYSTVLTNEASTFGWSYDGPRIYWWYAYLPDSQNHKIKVRNWFNDSWPTPSRPRLTDPFGYDNSQASSIPGILEYALDTLWNYGMSILHLPFPSPWGLILLSEGSGVTITRDSDLRGGTFRYNSDPGLQGADWLWYIVKPVNTGVYYIDEHALGEAGLAYISWYGSTFVKEADVDLYFFFYFIVVRS
jgi:hypothetical protein